MFEYSMWRRVSVWEVCEWGIIICGINGTEMIGTVFRKIGG